jgi:benzoyl-CoA reductase/2-hydroxyglutaryl-CoA dehydratase subunit BcrC/BadD/HgdB
MTEKNKLITDITLLGKNKIELLTKIDKPKIGWISIYTPEEILYAAGIIPYRITGDVLLKTTNAGAYMHRNICPYVLSCFEEGLEGIHDFNDGIIIVNACDARRKFYDVWKHFINKGFIHMLDMPKHVSSHSKNYYLNQIKNLITAIEKNYNCKITDANLIKSINLYNETRLLLNNLYDFRKNKTPVISGSQIMGIMKASMSGSKKIFNEKLAQLLEILKNESDIDTKAENKPRIIICGSYFDHTNLIELIEELGAIVVCEDISNGIKYFEGQIDTALEPIEAIGTYYSEKASSARMLDSEKRFQHLYKLINHYNADAVIYFSLKFCDNNLMDYPYQKEKLKNQGVQTLFLDIEREVLNIGQIKTRMQAFLETL